MCYDCCSHSKRGNSFLWNSWCFLEFSMFFTGPLWFYDLGCLIRSSYGIIYPQKLSLALSNPLKPRPTLFPADKPILADHFNLNNIRCTDESCVYWSASLIHWYFIIKCITFPNVRFTQPHSIEIFVPVRSIKKANDEIWIDISNNFEDPPKRFKVVSVKG